MLCTEEINVNSKGIDMKSTMEILEIMNREDEGVAKAVRASLAQIAELIDATVNVFRHHGRLFYIGSGTSGRLGVLDASECPPTFGVPSTMVNGVIAGGERALRNAIENAEDDKEKASSDLEVYDFSSSDMLIGLSAAGSTPYVVGAIEYAHSIGADTGCIVCNEESVLSRLVHHPVTVVVGPEIIQGSTRLKAGTAEKMVLNMISTISMVKLGYVYDNFMVNIQPTNIKLINRARRIIRQITGCDDVTARRYYQESGCKVAESVLMIKFSLSADEAFIALSEADFNLHKAIEACSAKF